MRGLEVMEGWTSDSGRCKYGCGDRRGHRRDIHTLIADQKDLAAMVCEADGVILHAWGAPDISQDDDLGGSPGLEADLLLPIPSLQFDLFAFFVYCPQRLILVRVILLR